MHRLALLALLVAACGGSSSVESIDAPAPDRDAASRDAPPGMPQGDASASTDPALDGSATVTQTTASIPGATSGRTLAATVFAPSTTGPHALVVISPGFQLARTQYTSYAKHLATWGFVAILTDYADTSFFPDHQLMATDVPAVITWAIAQPALAVDATKIGLAGHSLGGKISTLAAAADPRVRALVLWDPVDSSTTPAVPGPMSAVTAAVAVIGETTNAAGGFMPCAPAADNFTTFYAAAPSPALQATVSAADHMDWVDDPTCFVCTACGAGTAPPERTRTATRRLDVAWFRKHLLADTTYDSWLAATADVATVTK